MLSFTGISFDLEAGADFSVKTASSVSLEISCSCVGSKEAASTITFVSKKE